MSVARAWLQVSLGGLLGALLFIIWAGSLQPRTYQATARLVFPLPAAESGLQSALSASLGRLSAPLDSDLPLSTFDAILNSRTAAYTVGRKMGLDRLYGLTDRLSYEQFMDAVFAASLDMSNRTMKVSATLPGTPQFTSLGDVLSSWRRNERDRQYRELCAELVSALLAELDIIAKDIKLDRTRARKEDLARQLKTAQAALRRLQQELVAVRWGAARVEPAAAAEAMATRLFELRGELARSEAALAKVSQARREQEALLKRLAGRATSLTTDDPFLQPSRAAYQTAQAEYDRVARMYGPESPEVMAASLTLEQARRRLEADVASATSTLMPQVRDLLAEEKSQQAYRDQLLRTSRSLERELENLPELLAEVALRKAAVEQQVARIALLETQYQQAAAEYERHGVQWSILDPPTPPLLKSGPRLALNAMIGLVLGSLLFGWRAWLVILAAVAQSMPAYALRPGAEPETD